NQPASAGPLPDLVISSFGLQSWGVCAPGKTLMTFQVTVKNQGAAALSGQQVVVTTNDLKAPIGQEGGTGLGENLWLKPGESHTFIVPVSYDSAHPAFMLAQSPHPFQAVVNPKHTIQESNFANNAGPGPATWNGKKVIMVGVPKTCPKG